MGYKKSTHLGAWQSLEAIFYRQLNDILVTKHLVIYWCYDPSQYTGLAFYENVTVWDSMPPVDNIHWQDYFMLVIRSDQDKSEVYNDCGLKCLIRISYVFEPRRKVVLSLVTVVTCFYLIQLMPFELSLLPLHVIIYHTVCFSIWIHVYNRTI